MIKQKLNSISFFGFQIKKDYLFSRKNLNYFLNSNFIGIQNV